MFVRHHIIKQTSSCTMLMLYKETVKIET